MSKTWQQVPLSEILVKSDESVNVKPGKSYREITVRLWGKGVVQRREVDGAEISAVRRLVVRENQFILSRIDARNGAFGLVPNSLDGAVVSNDFPSFTLNSSRVNPSFLGWLSRTSNFVAICRAASEGTTNRVRLKEDRFLATEISLPPLSEQRRIVARIEELAAKIEQAQGLRREADLQCESLCRSIVFSDSIGSPRLTPMSELVRLKKPDVIVRNDKSYPFAGVYSFGRGVFKGQRKSGMEFVYTRLTQLQKGNFVYPKLMAWEGALGVVPPECDGLFVSPEFPVFEINESRVLPETLDVYFRTPSVWPVVAGISTGTNVRRRRLQPSSFLTFEMPLPSMSTQQLLRKVRTNIDSLKNLQKDTSDELDALLPSVLYKAFRGEL